MNRLFVLPAIERAIEVAIKTGHDVTLEVEGMRWSPQGGIIGYAPENKSVAMLVPSNGNDFRVFTFSATKILGIGELFSMSNKTQRLFGWDCSQVSARITPPNDATKLDSKSVISKSSAGVSFLLCTNCGHPGYSPDFGEYIKCPNCHREMYRYSEYLYVW